MARIAKSLDVLRAQINAAYPKRKRTSDGWIGDPAHAARTSDHNPNQSDVVQALDLTHDPKGGFDSYAFAETLRENKDKRLKYVISNGRIFSATTSPWTWRKYTGTNPHTMHVHVSVSDTKTRYDDGTPWEIGAVSKPVPDDDDVTASFKRRAPGVMRDLMRDFDVLEKEDAAAILGNLWGESKLQAIEQVGGGDGFGWAQWSGVRREAAEAFWRERGDRTSDAAQYAFLVKELKTTEKKALDALRKATTLNAKTKAFCDTFERAGKPRYEERYEGARMALDALIAEPEPTPVGNIRQLQEKLHELELDDVVGPVDGELGPKTKKAVRVVQRLKGLVVDGVPGPLTKAALGL